MICPTGRAQTKPRPNRNLHNLDLGKKIIKRVCDYYNLPLAELFADKRTDSIAWVRALSMDVCSMAGLTQETTGKLLRRKHSTVCFARQKVQDLCEQHPDLAEDRLKIAGEFIEFDNE
jgi:chromosomal replication initiation ATPase DnaA